jgi:uncharacterized membrane protein
MEIAAQPVTKKQPWKWLVVCLVFLLLIGWLMLTPSGLLGKADAIAYAICHRIASRSFTIDDRQAPLCARCTGMYLGALLGLLFQAVQGRRGNMPSLKIAAVFGVFVVAFGLDGVNSYLHLFPDAPGAYTPMNWLRLLTGAGMGLAISAAIAPAFRQTIWQTWEERSAFPGFAQVGWLVLLAAPMILAVLSQNPLLFYPLALLSAVSVLLLLTIIYTMVWVMILRHENQFSTFRQLWFYLVCGFGTALLQIATFDWVRLLITHTWQGFYL